jgi:hypothetical protein
MGDNNTTIKWKVSLILLCRESWGTQAEFTTILLWLKKSTSSNYFSSFIEKLLLPIWNDKPINKLQYRCYDNNFYNTIKTLKCMLVSQISYKPVIIVLLLVKIIVCWFIGKKKKGRVIR